MRIKWFSFKFGKIVSLFIIVIAGAFLRFDRLDSLMMFIGDQGWFYLSARDMLLTGNIPLVGITSSHTWLHQGPLWTYMLAGTLLISNFHPVSGAILTSLIGLGTIFLIYKIGSEFFSKNLGLIAALLYTTSPLVIIHARMPYHTSPIPFFASLLIYSFIKTIKGSSNWFPITILSISLLYNFELATVVFIPGVLGFLILGSIRKEKWFRKILNKKNIFLSIVSLGIPMIPILIYDFNRGFPQTLKFGGWFFYKGFQLIGIVEKSATEPFFEIVLFFINKVSMLIFAPNHFISVGVLVAALFAAALRAWKKKSLFSPLTVIFTITTIGIIGFFAVNTKSEAYLPMLFPGIILLVAFAIYSLFVNKTHAILVLTAISAINLIFIVQNNYLMDGSPGYGPSLKKRINAVEKILKQVDGKKYNIEGKGPGNEFESFTMNYEYLLWWKGNPPSHELQNLIFVIEEKQSQINVRIK